VTGNLTQQYISFTAAAAIALRSKIHERAMSSYHKMVLIFQPPNAHVRISRIFLHNAMVAAAVKNISILWCDSEVVNVNLTIYKTIVQSNASYCQLSIKTEEYPNYGIHFFPVLVGISKSDK
jgi:hypothetical protein